MSAVVTLINLGIVHDFFTLWMRAFIRAWIVAFPAVLLVVPVVRRIVRYLVVSSH